MGYKFTNRTFEYFDQARKHRRNLDWFKANKQLYLEEVREPFAHLIDLLDRELSHLLPKVAITPRKIKRPIYSAHRPQPDGSVIRPQTSAYFAEKQNTRFEWNPGIFLEFGDEEVAGQAGLGLYELTSRQRSRLRAALVEDFHTIRGILKSKGLKAWGPLAGERYVRFPQGFDPESPAADLLMQKEFYLSRNFTRAQIVRKDFIPTLVMDFVAAAPFLVWIRESVGIYDGRYQFGRAREASRWLEG